MSKKEKAIELSLLIAGIITVLITVGIVFILVKNSVDFFRIIPLREFLTSTKWAPLFKEKSFGVLPLLFGTLYTSFIALIVALPMGLLISVTLSEYMPKELRKVVKPILEGFSAIPTVVYGYIALMVVTPVLKTFIPSIESYNSLSAGIVMGFMIMPMISSLSEDALFAVPDSMREASFGLGASKFQTTFHVLIPFASTGIIVSVILAFARALAETMIVTIAAGQSPSLSLNPLKPIQTITSYIIEVSKGDVTKIGSAADVASYKSIYAVGLALFVLTFFLNSISFLYKRRIEKRYNQ